MYFHKKSISKIVTLEDLVLMEDDKGKQNKYSE